MLAVLAGSIWVVQKKRVKEHPTKQIRAIVVVVMLTSGWAFSCLNVASFAPAIGWPF
jgi:hypothetical protein